MSVTIRYHYRGETGSAGGRDNQSCCMPLMVWKCAPLFVCPRLIAYVVDSPGRKPSFIFFMQGIY